MKCFLCAHDNAIEFLNLGQQPLANKYPKKEEFATEDFFPLAIYFCANCKNVQLGTIVSRERMFEDYYYLSSVNQGLVRHFESLAKKLAPARLVVDIGSNDGILLKPLRALGVNAIGVDPSINVSKIANDAGLTTITAFFDSATVEAILKSYGAPDIVVASSVFTHLKNPHEFIENVKKLMDDDGQFIIEVEYILNILKTVQFERFYLDRIFYYSLTSLSRLCDMHNMIVVDAETIEPHGGSLRIMIRKKSHDVVPSQNISRLLDEEKEALTISKLNKFTSSVDVYVKALRKTLHDFKKSKYKVAGYGAPARVATICNYGNIGPNEVEFIVDDSPLKQNRFSPGTHIPIVPKDYLEKHPVDILVVFAYEYFNDIKEKTGDGYRYLMSNRPEKLYESQRINY